MLALLKRPINRGANGVSRRETFWALQDVSFEVKQGEVLGIIGRNGAGKSTLLKILSRITKPTVGYAEVYGRVGSLLEVGTGFHPELTGRENIFLNGAILGMTRREIQRRFDEIVDFAEVEQFLDTPVKRYSSGMYMRLAFAVAAHLDPEILIVDEVLAVGDAKFQEKCLGKMSEVAKGGRTVLFVSHNMNAVEELCTCAMLLNRGHIVQYSNDVRAIITRYLKSSESDVSEWVNEGDEFKNPYFQPQRICIVDRNGSKAIMPLRNDDEVYVQVEGRIETLDPALTIGCAVFTDAGQLLYWSYQTDVAESDWVQFQKGICTLKSKLPSHMLNEGNYRIEFIGGLHFREWLFEPGVKAPSINIEIQGGLSESPYWMTKRPGLLAPVIEWEVIPSNESQ
ncbi:MAG: ABC transporter ATP-binding protein [Anaerolineae bacterium]